MGYLLTQKQCGTAGLRAYQADGPALFLQAEHLQLAAVFKAPIVIQVKHQADHPGSTPSEAVQMALVKVTSLIGGVVRLVSLQPQEQPLIETGHQLVQEIKQPRLRLGETLQPGDLVASNAAILHQV